MLDKLPLLASRVLRTDKGRNDADRFLSRLRQCRQAPEFRGWLRMLVGGSIGLDGGGYDMACAILDLASRSRNGAGPAELVSVRQRDLRTFASVIRDLEANGYLLRQGERLYFRSNLVREWWRKGHWPGGAA